MDDYQPTSRLVLWRRFLLGMFWLAVIAAGGSTIAECGFLTAYLVVICGALFSGALCLAWLIRWTLNENARAGQFGIASLFFLMTLLAVYFAAVRFLLVHAGPPGGQPPPAALIVVPTAFTCLLAAICSIPFVLGIFEALLWFAV